MKRAQENEKSRRSPEGRLYVLLIGRSRSQEGVYYYILIKYLLADFPVSIRPSDWGILHKKKYDTIVVSRIYKNPKAISYIHVYN